MSAPHLRLVPDPSLPTALRRRLSAPARARPAKAPRQRPPLGQLLLETRAISPGNLVKALALQNRSDATLGEILLAHKWVTEDSLEAALVHQWRAAPPDEAPDPDPTLISAYGAARCLAQGILPLRRIGGAVLIGMVRPDQHPRHQDQLRAVFGHTVVTYLPERIVQRHLQVLAEPELVARAEARPEAEHSCRSFGRNLRARRWALGALCALGVVTILAPVTVASLALAWALVTLLATTVVKAVAMVMALNSLLRPQVETFQSARDAPGPTIVRLPKVSVLVPLFKEPQIAPRLIKRLARQNYPKELMDICLVVESDDILTKDALARTRLPHWMRVIEVPQGGLKTKPRALNYALDLAKGSIVGIWDAEDAPAPDQLHQVVRRFHTRGPKVACLQGVLHYYNSSSNWLTRCFTIEYAAWFRVILPGAARLGLPVPLGGTTVFFRRDVLEQVGAWDAHNVTEDADLGIRLGRLGYRTELIHSVTGEEANSRLIPWIKQRSRWLKGYAVTWAVHTRNPLQLWRDLGPRGFLWVQLLFLGTLSQFALAPLLWSFWPMAFGLSHPLAGALPGGATWGTWGTMATWAITATFVLSEAVSLIVAFLGARNTRLPFLWVWVPTLVAYFPLAALACYKALWELIWAPFYWDKTAHGHDDVEEDLVNLDLRGKID